MGWIEPMALSPSHARSRAAVLTLGPMSHTACPLSSPLPTCGAYLSQTSFWGIGPRAGAMCNVDPRVCAECGAHPGPAHRANLAVCKLAQVQVQHRGLNGGASWDGCSPRAVSLSPFIYHRNVLLFFFFRVFEENENPYLVKEKQQQQQPLHLPSIPQKFVQSIRTIRQTLQETKAGIMCISDYLFIQG